MSNQVILWSLIILPWFTLFFMSREDIRRLMPVGLFSSLISIIAVEAGQTLGWFVLEKRPFPLKPRPIFSVLTQSLQCGSSTLSMAGFGFTWQLTPY